MFCGNCGKENPDGEQICKHCGQPMIPRPSAPKEPDPKPPRKGGILRIIAVVTVFSLVFGIFGFIGGFVVGTVKDIAEMSAPPVADNTEEPKQYGYTFVDGVKVLPDAEPWESAGSNSMILPNGEETPEKGQIIVFGSSKAIRVESVKTSGDQTKITYSEPELHEFLDYLMLSGDAALDFANFQPAEDVTVTEMNGQSLSAVHGPSDWFDVEAEELTVNECTSLRATKKLGSDVELTVELDIKIPTVAYAFDIDFNFNPFSNGSFANVKNAYVQITNNITVTGSIVASHDFVNHELAYPDYIELGSVPLLGADGIGIVLELDLVISGEGEFELEYNVFGSLGVQVLNNRAHNISDLQSSVSIGLSASLKIGPQLQLLAEVFGKDVLSFSAEAGVQVAGSVHLRSTGVVCLDGTVNAYAEISAFEGCLLDEWLDIALIFTIWDEDNSPFKFNIHCENLQRVDACSYDGGTIHGTVANADNRTSYIENAVIEIVNHDDFSVQQVVYSDRNGNYTAVVPGGTYLVRISANGYLPFESLEVVGEAQEIYLETYLLVEGDANSNYWGYVGGAISNSVNGFGVNNAKLTVRKGWNMVEGEVVDTVYTHDGGYYELYLPIGNYTISIECDGYVSNHFNVAVTRSGNWNCNAVINPNASSDIELGDLRIVLTWGNYPEDLDSHLWYQDGDGYGVYHIFSSNEAYYKDQLMHANLDVDDTTSYGPETITVYQMEDEGIYSYYVHNYTHKNSTGSTTLANSGAKVQVYMGETLIAQYFVPTSGVGTVWHVFDFDAENGQIIAVNTFEEESNPSYVGEP